MKIFLSKRNYHYFLVRRNPVAVESHNCASKSCFDPHDCGYINDKGYWTHDFQCKKYETEECTDKY